MTLGAGCRAHANPTAALRLTAAARIQATAGAAVSCWGMPVAAAQLGTALGIAILLLFAAATTTGSTIGVTLNCQDVPIENCPDHGAAVAAAAEAIMPSVYGGGVIGMTI